MFRVSDDKPAIGMSQSQTYKYQILGMNTYN